MAFRVGRIFIVTSLALAIIQQCVAQSRYVMDNANGVSRYFAMAIDVCFTQTAKTDANNQKYVKYVCTEETTNSFVVQRLIYDNSDCNGQGNITKNITSSTQAPPGCLPGDTYNCVGSNSYTFVDYHANQGCNGNPIFRIPVVSGCFCGAEAAHNDSIKSYNASCGNIRFYSSTDCSGDDEGQNYITNAGCTLSSSYSSTTPGYVYSKTSVCEIYVSLNPTINPTISPTTTTTTTVRPSENPTINPSAVPTNIPSIYPSFYPSLYPTSNPSSNPIINQSVNTTSTSSKINQTSAEQNKNNDEDDQHPFGKYPFVIIGLMVATVLPTICIGIVCYHCINKKLTDEVEATTTSHAIQRLASGSPMVGDTEATLQECAKNENKPDQQQSSTESKGTHVIELKPGVEATPGDKPRGVVMMGFVNDNETINTNQESSNMESALVQNMHTSGVSTDELIQIETTSQTNTSNDTSGEDEGMNKYSKIENILKEIDEDEYETYLSAFKKQKVDDDAVFVQKLFAKDDAIWEDLMAEIGVRAKFLNAVQLNEDADV